MFIMLPHYLNAEPQGVTGEAADLHTPPRLLGYTEKPPCAEFKVTKGALDQQKRPPYHPPLELSYL